MALLIVFFLGLFFLIGALIVRVAGKNNLAEHISISLALGAMLAVIVFDLVPDIYESFDIKQLWIPVLFIIAGVVILKVLDKFIPDHESSHSGREENLVHIGIISTVAIVLHNVIEGMTVYSVSVGSVREGLSLAMGVGLHNIPMGMLIFTAVRSEKRYKKGIILALLSLSTFVGGVLMLLVQPYLTETIVASLVALALGMVLYIVFFELMPSLFEFKGKRGVLLTILFSFAGFGIVLLSLLFE